MNEEVEKAGKKIRNVREWKRKRESAILTMANRTPVALVVAIVALNELVVSVWSWKAIIILIVVLALIGEVASEWRIRKLERKNWELEDELQILRAREKI